MLTEQYPVCCSGERWLVDGLRQQPCSHQLAACVGHSRGFCHQTDYMTMDEAWQYDWYNWIGDESRGWLLQQDWQANTIARWTSVTTLGQDELQARILHHQGRALQYRDEDDTMDNRDEKIRNGKNVLAPEVHQHGEEHCLITSEQQRDWFQYGWMKDLWCSLKGLGNSSCAPPSRGWG